MFFYLTICYLVCWYQCKVCFVFYCIVLCSVRVIYRTMYHVQVMAANGVSHHIVEDDLAGVEAMLKWLAFVPATFPGTLPILRSTDPIGRDIEYVPQKGRPCAFHIIN